MNTTNKLFAFLKKYKHAWVFLYFFIYMPWFIYLEKNIPSGYNIIHSAIDDKIPFIEYFIVPYLLWFVFIAAVLLYFFFTDVSGFYKLTTLLFTGMTIFLLISTFFPNGLALRPTSFVRDNIFVDMVKVLYATDTSTNVFPSLHVFNSLGVCIGIAHSDALKKHNLVRYASYILAVLIILATMFLKQHSIIDVVFGFIMAYGLNILVYAPATKKQTVFSKQTSF
ncbi:MAG: phosphatase PAP2 family protein [Hespellia sp.]|nr:phosphatase PAP2 family protein [Hespellia sp.]